MYLVLVGENKLYALLERPLHVNIRVIPHKAALIVRMIKVRHLVAEFCLIGEYQKSMCEVLRDEELFLILRRQHNTEGFAEGFAAFS